MDRSTSPSAGPRSVRVDIASNNRVLWHR